MLADFQWLRPEWLLAAPLVVGLCVLLARGKLGAGRWHSVIDAALMPYVLSRDPGRGSDYRWWLLGLGGLIAVAALAGPAWERIEQPVFREQQALVVALDLSRSMDAEDIAPSRLVRARLKILDILERRQTGQTALLVYSGNAFTVTPLTNDTDTVASLVNSLSTDIMPSRGSYPEVAIAKGRALLDQANVRYGEILLITDGGSSPAAEAATEELVAAGYSLSVLGVGTLDGAPIPRGAGGFVTDSRGRIAVARLEERGLAELAGQGGGRYARLSPANDDLDTLLSGEIAGAGRHASDDALATDRWREEGPWLLLLLLLPLAAFAFRRGWVFAGLIFLVPFPEQAQAGVWDDLWFNKDQQGARLLEDGAAAEAAQIFDDEEWRAIANYRASDFAASDDGFAKKEDARNLYNFGNAKALQGELDDAISAYEKTLQLEPDNEDAQYNLDLVRQLKQQQEANEQQQGDQQSSENSGEESDQSDSQSESSDENAEGESQSEGDSEQGDPSQGDDQEMSEEDLQALQEELQRAAEAAEDGEAAEQLSEAELAELREQQEQQQAMEQWLRRVPDDPGGLLRNKFRYQYQRSGVDQDGNTVWPDNEAQPW